MKHSYILLLTLVLFSCNKKDGNFYIEYDHKNGAKYLSLIHSDFKCKNVNGALNKIDDWTYVNHDGYCNKCITSKEISNVDTWIAEAEYNKESLDALLSLVEISRSYYEDDDDIPEKEFIKRLLIDNQKNIEAVYDYYNNRKNSWGKRGAYLLLKMEKPLFLIRVKRWAEYYLKDKFYLVKNEEREARKDLITNKGGDDES